MVCGMKALALVALNPTATRKNLTQTAVVPLLLELTWPIFLGLLSVTLFNVWEVYLLSQLGKTTLAAYGFCAPWMMAIPQLAGGLGVGASTLVARSVGQNDWPNARRYASETFKLGTALSLVLIAAGLWLMPSALQAMGARGEVLAQATGFLHLWWMGLGTVILATLTGAILRAMGDTRHASLVLLLSAGLNALLDPLLIWGTPFSPAMGLTGVAQASMISRAISLGLGLWWVARKRQLLCKDSLGRFRHCATTWAELWRQGFPSALASLAVPVGFILVTSVVAQIGPGAVGAFGLVGRIESLALLPLWSLTMALAPLVSQNIAAGHFARSQVAIDWTLQISGWLGLGLMVLLSMIGQPLAKAFIHTPETAQAVVVYLRWAPLGYGALGVLFAISSGFSAVGKPVFSLGLNVLRMGVCYWPLALLGHDMQWGWRGVVIAGMASYWLSGLVALALYRRYFTRWAQAFHHTAQATKTALGPLSSTPDPLSAQTPTGTPDILSHTGERGTGLGEVRGIGVQ
jgi:putative MATE family efflux protein